MADNKIQYSKKFADGTIVLVGGDTVKEFEDNYQAFVKSPVVADLFKSIKEEEVAQRNTAPKTNNTGEVETVTLPDDAVLEIIHKGDKYYGDVSPFPGTKYPVRVWPEVLETIADDLLASGLCNVGGWVVKFAKNDKGYPSKITEIVF